MADQKDRTGPTPGTNNTQPAGGPSSPPSSATVTEAERQRERDRQNRDDPSRAPESGDRK
jgi:hypothetical protein